MKVAVYFATGYEEIEALSVVDVLRRAKVEVLMVGVDGKSVTSTRQITINMDTTIEELDHTEIDMIVLPGGMPGTRNLGASEMVVKNIKAFKEQGKWLAAICAAPSVLGENGLLENEKATCYPGFEEALIGCEYTADRTVISNKIITGKGAGAALEFSLLLLTIIKGEEVANQIKESMLIKE